MRGRNKANFQQAIVQASYFVRLQNERDKSIQDYFDELLTDTERMEKSSLQLALMFDRVIARQKRDAKGA